MESAKALRRRTLEEATPRELALLFIGKQVDSNSEKLKKEIKNVNFSKGHKEKGRMILRRRSRRRNNEYPYDETLREIDW